MRARCDGLPIITRQREDPTEYDTTAPCGWTGAVSPDWRVVDRLLASWNVDASTDPEAAAAARKDARRRALRPCPGCGGVTVPDQTPASPVTDQTGDPA